MKPTKTCKHLRTKAMFIPALSHGTAEPPAEDFGHSSHFWCNCTLSEAGPDDRPVGPQKCGPSRPCFEE